MNNKYYLDSCIWLNLFKKEVGGDREFPHWEIALDFLENVEEREGVIYVSSIVLKELYFTMKGNFWIAKKFFKENEFIEVIKTTSGDYDLARDFERDNSSRLSFYDYLHVAIAKGLDCCLVTRDRDLIEFTNGKIKVCRPEDLIG